MKKCPICKLVVLFGGVGALNLGLMSLLGTDYIGAILGGIPLLNKGVHVLIGLSGLILIVTLIKACPCSTKSCS